MASEIMLLHLVKYIFTLKINNTKKIRQIFKRGSNIPNRNYCFAVFIEPFVRESSWHLAALSVVFKFGSLVYFYTNEQC